tara:strand:+ start:299 stop:559 length:261 start_codon:yes stop_codon:yes gene_type:complete
MKIKSMIGWDGSYITFEVDNGGSYYCLGDMIWCGDDTENISDTGELLLIHETMTREDIIDWAKENNLHPSQRRVLLGMLTQSGVIY